MEKQVSELYSQINFWRNLVNDYRTLQKKNDTSEVIYSVHECNDTIFAVILKESFSPRENYIPCSYGKRIGYSFYLFKAIFRLFEITNGNFKYIGDAILDFRSESTSDKFEEPVTLEHIEISDKNYHGHGFGSILMADIITYCRDKKMNTIIGMKSYVDTNTPEKYEHWHRFYVERWGFTETENGIILRIPD